MLEQGVFEDSTPSPLGPIQHVWWNPGWLPMTSNFGGAHQCVDMRPDYGGKMGQIVDFSPEVGPVRILATSFAIWISQFADDLEADKYRFDTAELWLVPIKSRKKA